MKHIYTKDSKLDKTKFGSKAYTLASLDKKFSIPKWVVLSPQILQDFDTKEFLAYIDDEFKGCKKFAVRSSSQDEDTDDNSYAGMFESLLNVDKNDLLESIKTVFDSHTSSRVKEYAKANNTPLPSSPSVIIQKMLNPSCAGVAFSSDPNTSDREFSIVSATKGLGDKLVDGEVNGDTFFIKQNSIYSKKLDDEKSVIEENEVLLVAKLAKELESLYKHPQDIEWAFENKKLYLLQSRPITSIKQTLDGEKRLWDNSNIVESYSGVTTPLTYSFARYIYEEVYIEFCKVLSVPSVRVTQNSHSFKTLLGLLNGQIYYNLLSWNRILALLPGFKFNREFMEQMMGVKEGLPPSIVKELESASSGSKLIDALGLVKTLLSLIYQQVTIKSTIKKFYKRLEKALIPNAELKKKNVDELVMHYRGLEAQLLKRWDAPLINDFLAMIYFGTLGKLCKKWLDADEYLQNDLLIDSEEIISAQPAKRIMQMADILRLESKEVIDIFQYKDANEIKMYLKNLPELNRLLDQYLKMFGDRTLEELKLESFTLEDDATTLYRAIASMASRPKAKAKNTDQKERAEQIVTNKLKNQWLKLRVMNFVIKQARQRVSSRENLRFERTKLFGHIRRIFLEIGLHFENVSILKEQRDIFYLEVNEIFAFIEGCSTTQNLKAIVDLRKKEFATFKTKDISERTFTYGAVNYNNSFKSTYISKNDTLHGDGVMSGFGCCPGEVKAKVRVIENPKDAFIKEGEILVAKQTDPGWIMLFPASSGILVERGSMLSHSAIVAREMNIPAIVGVDNLLKNLKTGDEVLMDGSTGIIKKLVPSDDNV